MSRYEVEYDHEDNDDYDERRHDDVEAVVAPVITPVNNTINVVVNPPVIEVINNVTVIETQVSTVINTPVPAPPAPTPIPPPPKPPATNYIYGSSKNDYLVGTDLNDVIYGYQGNDTLIDGTGADKLYGAKGKNTYSCTADGQTDFVYVKKDSKPDVIRSVGLEDRIDIQGSKFTFASTSKGIEIFFKSELQAVYTGKTLTLAEIQSITV